MWYWMGMGSELQQRGVELHKIAWSATANYQNQGIVQNIHEDYIRAGSQVITAKALGTAENSFIARSESSRALA